MVHAAFRARQEQTPSSPSASALTREQAASPHNRLHEKSSPSIAGKDSLSPSSKSLRKPRRMRFKASSTRKEKGKNPTREYDFSRSNVRVHSSPSLLSYLCSEAHSTTSSVSRFARMGSAILSQECRPTWTGAPDGRLRGPERLRRRDDQSTIRKTIFPCMCPRNPCSYA